MGKDNYKMRREAFKFCDLVRLILETLRQSLCYMKEYKWTRGMEYIQVADITTWDALNDELNQNLSFINEFE